MTMVRLFTLLLGWGVLLGTAPSVCGQGASWPCDGSLFLSMRNGEVSQLYRVQLDTAGPSATFETIPLSDPSAYLTALGYSIQDGYLYALDFLTHELLRIDALGVVTRLGVPENLDTNLRFYGGTVNTRGTSLRVIGRDPVSGKDVQFQSIDLFGPNHYAGVGSVVSNLDVALSDFATGPFLGVTYGFDQNRRQLVTIGGGTVSTYAFSAVAPNIEALFFGIDGQLYSFGDRDGGLVLGDFFLMQQFEGGAGRLQSGPNGRNGDGCSCPYSVQFNRTITPPVAPPCGEVLIRYDFVNHTGQGRLGLVLRDALPPGFEILEIVENGSDLGDIDSGVGSNLFEMSGMDIVLGLNTTVLRVRVPDEPGQIYETQASLTNLPRALGNPLLSDDAALPGKADPNRLAIVDPDTLQLENYLRYSCNRDTVFLGLPFPADEYLWSTGSREAVLPVTQDGPYWLEARGACFDFSDTIVVAGRPDGLTLELGPDLERSVGERVRLVYQTNIAPVTSRRWEVAGESELSCLDCPNPEFTVVSDERITLTVRNAEGCTLTDELLLRAFPERNVYFPNAFSPNNDGINDYFFPQSKIAAELLELSIFDRWGSKVFVSEGAVLNDQATGWDGRIAGEPANPGIYLYFARVRFFDGAEDVFSGEILLLRD